MFILKGKESWNLLILEEEKKIVNLISINLNALSVEKNIKMQIV